MASNFKMADLKRPKLSLKEKTPGHISPDPYSYDHRISLDQDTLDKLGMDVPKVGDQFHAMGHAEVKSVSQNDRGQGDKNTRVELQFKRLGIKPKAGSAGGGLKGAVEQGISEANSSAD